MRFRLVIGLILAAALAWSGWWWFGASAQKQALEDWLAERRAAGWAAEAEIEVTGFPNRFDMIAEDLVLADPESGWAWRAPEFRTYMLSYQPNEVIAAWPGTHTLSVPGETVEARAERLRASAAFAPDARLALRRAVVKAEGLSLESRAGWSAAVADGQLSIRSSEEARGRENAYDAVLEMTGLRPPQATRALLGRRLGEGLPETLDELRLDATAAFRAPLDRAAVESGRMRPETVWIRPSVIRWGDLRLEVSGRLEVDPDGVPEGVLDVEARNWRKLLSAAVEAGAVNPDIAGALETGLGLLSGLTSDGDGLAAPLRFSGGTIFLGPVPIGESFRF